METRHEQSGGGSTHFPSLPAGYHAYVAFRFRDSNGRWCEFNRVYGPPQRDARGAFSRLDPEQSFWSFTWPAGEDRLAGLWLNYSDARRYFGPNLTFERYASLSFAKQVLPVLFRGAGSRRLELHPAVSTASS